MRFALIGVWSNHIRDLHAQTHTWNSKMQIETRIIDRSINAHINKISYSDTHTNTYKTLWWLKITNDSRKSLQRSGWEKNRKWDDQYLILAKTWFTICAQTPLKPILRRNYKLEQSSCSGRIFSSPESSSSVTLTASVCRENSINPLELIHLERQT